MNAFKYMNSMDFGRNSDPSRMRAGTSLRFALRSFSASVTGVAANGRKMTETLAVRKDRDGTDAQHTFSVRPAFGSSAHADPEQEAPGPPATPGKGTIGGYEV